LCLHSAAPDALFVCENALTEGAPAIAVSRDQGKTVTGLARFADIEGPVTCSTPDARVNLCSGSWPETKALFSPAPDAAPPPSRRRSRRDAGADASKTDSTASPRRSTCGCDVVGRDVPALDLRWLIPGIFPLIVRARSFVKRGSRLTQLDRS
ncbi:MAG TPA: hypothetical protein VM580_18885, partial [Labilithrix sp.]|nr:hypothetical protein [Labilithrix sp.]